MSTSVLKFLDGPLSHLSPKTLGRDLENLASWMLTGQAHALLVLRQPAPKSAFLKSDLVRGVQRHQSDIKREASLFLNRIVRDLIAAMAEVDRVGNYVSALQATALPELERAGNSKEARDDVASMVLATTEMLDQAYGKAATLAGRLMDCANAIEKRREAIDKAIDRMVEELDGPEGTIAAINEEIEKTREAIEINIHDIVSGGKAIGDGLKSLITSPLLEFTETQCRKKETEKNKKKEEQSKKNQAADADRPDDNKRENAPDDKQGDLIMKSKIDDYGKFGVDSLTPIGTGVNDLASAAGQLHKNNARLAQLYARLADLEGTLAVARALGDQIEAFCKAMSISAATARTLETTWSQIEAGFRSYIEDIRQIDVTGASIAPLAAALDRAPAAWAPIRENMNLIKDALAAADTLASSAGSADD